MANRINLVTGDNLPVITLTFTDLSNNAIIDLSDPGVTVRVHFRATGATEVIATIPCAIVGDGKDGRVSFSFGNTLADITPGKYEGEVEIDYDGQIQTVYEPLQFTVREQFA